MMWFSRGIPRLLLLLLAVCVPHHIMAAVLPSRLQKMKMQKGLGDYIPYQEEGEFAFSVSRTQDLDSAGSPVIVEFDKVHNNHGFASDILASVFRAPVAGTYFFTFNTRSGLRKGADMVLHRNGDFVISAHALPVIMMAGNEVVLELQAFYTVNLELQPHSYINNTFSNSSESYTVFSGHLIQEFSVVSFAKNSKGQKEKKLGDIIRQNGYSLGFTAVRDTELVAGNNPTPLTFERVISNVGNGFNLVSSQLIAPLSGMYLVTFTMFSMQTMTVTMMLNDQPQVDITASLGSASTRIVVRLNESDSIWLSQEAFTSVANCSFSGILISPYNNAKTRGIGFSGKTAPSSPVTFMTMRQAPFESGLSPVKLIFDTVRNNIGDGFDVLSSHFYAPVSGVYSFLFSGISSGNMSKHVIFYHNSASVVGSFALMGRNTGINHVILRMDAFDTVSLELQPVSKVSDCNCMVFSGYLIYELGGDTITVSPGLFDESSPNMMQYN